MKTLFLLILTAFVSTGAIFAGLNGHRVLLGYGIAFICWLLFFRLAVRR